LRVDGFGTFAAGDRIGSMNDDFQDLEPIDLSDTPTVESPVAQESPTATYTARPTAGTYPPGWYADPWTAGQYRYWSGQTWTGETNRWGPATGAVAQTPGTTGSDDRPPGTSTATAAWPSTAAPVSDYGAAAPASARSAFEVTPTDGASTRPSGRVVAGVIGLVLLLIVSGGVGYAINSHSHSKREAIVLPGPVSPTPTTPSTGTPSTAPASTDPGRHVLSSVVVQQADVAPSRTVVLIPQGNSTSQPTLDLCNGTYPSEGLRTARLQVADVDAAGDASLSTEAVLYRNPAAAAQALAELRKVSAACPHSPVVSPVGEGTAETVFKAAPDAAWPQSPTVQRQAYSMVTTVAGTGTEGPSSAPSIAVYLRRGRALMGVYFPDPSGAQPAVAGQRTIEGIVAVFEARMAKLPASVVNGHS
jgi:Protein of unknown function (DUF2510)